ncbi:MAG: uncharacterized protein QOF07_1398 [Bradyrhizobium sp.]|jgi:hypothetical protein|nr:uncharacterized protein [Bradyrhizobium sp.]
MKSLSRSLSAVGLVLGLALAGTAAGAQQPPAAPQGAPLKPASPAAIAAAKEILAMKNASAMYASAVPNLVQQTKDTLLQSNLNYQKDLNEVSVIVAQKLAGREKEIGEGMANVYANEFTEQELKDLVTFYKSPLGQKLLTSEPRAIQLSMAYMNQWAQRFSETVNGEFRAEMRKRGKEI